MRPLLFAVSALTAFAFCVTLWLPVPAVAQTDPLARSEINHLRELIQSNDKRYEQRFDAQEKAVGAALAAQKELSAQALANSKEAITKADVSTEKRFEAVNEFRSTLRDQQNTFMTRKEAEASMAELTRQVRDLQARVDKAEGQGSGAWNLWVLIGGGVVLLVGVLGILIRFMTLGKKDAL
jgi:hypothetical protein